MITVLKDVVKTANSLVILFNGESERFDANVQQMLREMEALFGKETFWTHAILGVSHWSYSLNDQNVRNATGKNEEWWTWEMNRQLQDKFHIGANLSAVFIDSWAKMSFNVEDPLQQDAFDRETQKLWDLTMALDVFEFKTIEDVLNELTVCKSTLENNITEIWRAIESSADDIQNLSLEQAATVEEVAMLTSEVATLSDSQMVTNSEIWGAIESASDDLQNLSLELAATVEEVAMLTSEVAAFSVNQTVTNSEIWMAIVSSDEAIAKNAIDITDLRTENGEISDEVLGLSLRQEEIIDDLGSLSAGQEQNTADISSHQEVLDSHSEQINTNSAAIEEINIEISTFIEKSAPPLGTILPWTSRPTKDTTNFISSVPDGWQLCDGGPIARGPWLGKLTPNLNGNELFLRGSSTGDKVLDVEDDSFQDHTHVDNGHSHVMNPHSHTPKGGGKFFADGDDFGGWLDYSESGGYPKRWVDTADTVATMQSANSGIGLVTSSYKRGAETRPKNMRVQYIIRIE